MIPQALLFGGIKERFWPKKATLEQLDIVVGGRSSIRGGLTRSRLQGFFGSRLFRAQTVIPAIFRDLEKAEFIAQRVG